jgi:predicted metal-dependent RNase
MSWGPPRAPFLWSRRNPSIRDLVLEAFRDKKSVLHELLEQLNRRALSLFERQVRLSLCGACKRIVCT